MSYQIFVRLTLFVSDFYFLLECRSTKFAFAKLNSQSQVYLFQNPPSCDDVCWLLDVSIEIGDPEYVRMFCEKVIASISSPFVLIELFKSVLKVGNSFYYLIFIHKNFSSSINYQIRIESLAQVKLRLFFCHQMEIQQSYVCSRQGMQ